MADSLFIDTEVVQHFLGSDGSTTFTDESYDPKTATAQGDAQLTTSITDHGASVLTLDGTGDYFTLPNDGDDWQFLHDGAKWTWEARVRIPSISGQYTFFATNSGTASDLGVWLGINSSRQLRMIVGRNDPGDPLIDYTSTATFPSDSDFHHIVVEWTPQDDSVTNAIAWGVDGTRKEIASRNNLTRNRDLETALFYAGRAVTTTSLDFAGQFSFQRLTANRARYDLVSNSTYTEPTMPVDTTQEAGYGGEAFGKRTLVDTAATATAYESEPQLLEVGDNKILCAYRSGADHNGVEGRVVCRISETNGLRWGEEIVIDDESNHDVRNPVLGRDPSSGRVICVYRTDDNVGNHDDVYFRTSTDDGATWSARTSLGASLTGSGRIAPFGPIVETSNGLMVVIYSVPDDFAEALFSTDGGQSWGNRTTIYDTEPSANGYNEPWVIALDQNDLVIGGRIEGTANDEFHFWRSANGGSSWSFLGVVDFHDGGNLSLPGPCSIAEGLNGDIITVWQGRDPLHQLYIKTLTAAQFDADPTDSIDRTAAVAHTTLEDGFFANYATTGGGSQEFGYPFLLQTSQGNMLCAWYDSANGGNTRTAIYIRSIASYAAVDPGGPTTNTITALFAAFVKDTGPPPKDNAIGVGFNAFLRTAADDDEPSLGGTGRNLLKRFSGRHIGKAEQ